jgi:hypothetical protein
MSEDRGAVRRVDRSLLERTMQPNINPPVK